MKLKTIAMAVFLAANGAAHAAPTMQTCAPMEITHNGNSGLSYSLACDAGGWSMKYTGAVPPGNDSVMARYRVQVSNPDGSTFAHSRSVRLPSPSLLGQALVREAVMLDNGDLALRDCQEFNCTLYRPLGSAEKISKATITVTPEIKRLSDEAARLNAELAKRQVELAAQHGKVSALQREVSTLTSKLGGAELTLATAKSALDSAKQQHTADLDGLLTSSKAEIAGAAASAGAQSGAQIAKLNEQLVSVSGALDAARKELAECSAAHGVAEEAKAKADAEVQARGKQVAELQASLRSTEVELARVLDGYDAKIAALTEKQAQPGAGAADLAAMRLKLDAANRDVEKLLTKVSGLEYTLGNAGQQLKTAQAAQASRETVLTAATDSQERLRAVLEMALAEAQITIAELTTARSAEVGELQSSLAEANQNLASAQAQLAGLASRPAPSDGGQVELSAATTRIDELVNKVAGLEVALDFANQNLADAQSAQGGSDAAFADLTSAYERNLAQLAVVTNELAQARLVPAGEPTSNVDVSVLNEKLVATTAERDAAVAEAARLKAAMATIATDVESLEASRLSALLGAKKVATDMLDALDRYDALESAKNDSDKALASTTNKLMETSTKLQAANLARELAMQAATTAHADADAQNLKNEELAKRLARSNEQTGAQQLRIDGLESATASQALELAELRKHLADRGVKPENAPSAALDESK